MKWKNLTHLYLYKQIQTLQNSLDRINYEGTDYDKYLNLSKEQIEIALYNIKKIYIDIGFNEDVKLSQKIKL